MLFTSIATTLTATGIQALEILAPYISWPVLSVYAVGTFVLFFTGWNTFHIFHNSYHVSPAYIKKDQGKRLVDLLFYVCL
jgi:purine-cytosine permease-like protein